MWVIESTNIAANDVLYAYFNTNASAVDYVLVYQGTIGSSNGTALDPVDSGIAIATTTFTNNLSSLPGPLMDFGTLAWDNPPDAEFAIGYSFSGNTFSISASNNFGWNINNNGNLTYSGPGNTSNLHVVVRSSTRNSTVLLTITDSDGNSDIPAFSLGSLYPGTYDFSFTVPASSGDSYQVNLNAYASDTGPPRVIDLTATLTP